MPHAFHIVSSQFKLLPKHTDADVVPRVITCGSSLKNEPFSFQFLYRTENLYVPISISVTAGDLPIAVWRVDNLSVNDAANLFNDAGYVDDAPGIYPDLLMARPTDPELLYNPGVPHKQWFEKDTNNLLNAINKHYQSLWITVNPDSVTVPAGTHDINIKVTNLFSGDMLFEERFPLQIIDALLPAHDVYYTNWFHEDALCDFHNVEPYSEDFYRIFDEYLRNAVRHRQNTLLLPAFTPPLDTPVGAERMNVQLTDIENIDGQWIFGFERMKTFIEHAKACGIRYFEHCHLFSQWGAEHTPNIYDTGGKRIFGYDTDAVGEAYQTFLHAYLDAFFAFAKKEGIYDRLVFHISDEPKLEQLENYRKAYHSVADALADFPTADAMSHVEFYTEGLVKQPVPYLDKAPEFEAVHAPFWVYYTAGPYHLRCANRLITNTAARTRVLGVQMYRYQALGFLHWGYNFYYDRLSAGVFDPKSNPCGYKQLPGCSYLAYPLMGQGDCHVAPSIREKHMTEAFDDLRALKLLESYIGREAVLALCEKHLGEPVEYTTIPERDALFHLREEINRRIQAAL